MRAVFGLVGLLITLAIVSVLVSQQMTRRPTLQALTSVDSAIHADTAALAASGTAAQNIPQIEQQFKQALDKAVQPRPMPDDTP